MHFARRRDRLIYLTNKTWPAFSTVIFGTLVYVVWNVAAPRADRFDPFPFILLGVLYTVYSLWQNYMLLIQAEEQSVRTEMMLRTILHIAEATQVLLEKRDVATVADPGTRPRVEQPHGS